MVHVIWLTTHVLRTVFERDPSTGLLESLSSEVKVLQAELHRAHRLIEGYNLAFEREERASRFQIRGLELFTLIIFFLTLLLWKAWVCPRRAVAEKPVLALSGGTGGSSDSDSPEESVRLPSQSAVARPRTSGPIRPSQLGKGSRK